MTQLAIQGHKTRESEVITLLEMLGGKNQYAISADAEELLFTIRKGDNFIVACYPIDKFVFFTLEEFLEKFPYKIGDKVKCWINGYCSINTVKDIQWDGVVNEIKYKIQDYWYSTMNLQPYKEETMEKQKAIPPYMDYDVRTEEPKELLIGFTKDDNGDWILNTHKDYKIKEENGIFKLIKKQPQYPKTYIECAKILDCFGAAHIDGYKNELLDKFQELLICHNAYWKIAGEQMGLGKPWEPDWKDGSDKYFICYLKDELWMSNIRDCNRLLVFPTAEMRDAFYESFKDLIETCKELL